MSAATDVLGLDKLAFYLSASQVDFSPGFEATVEQPRLNSATGELDRSMELWHARASRARGNHVVSGTKAYLNAPDYQFTVKPDLDNGTAVCLVQFSAGAFEETNLHPLDRDGAAEIALKVERDLAARGAKLKLDAAKLVRLDIARNIALEEPVASYAPIFATVGGRKRTSKQDFGGTGFLLGNTRWQWSFYDKGAQMREKGIEAALCPSKTLRPELRLSNAAIIRERLGLTACTLPELRENWPLLAPAFDKSLRSEFFRQRNHAAKPSSLDLNGCAEAALETSKYRAFDRCFADFGIAAAIQQMGKPAVMNLVAGYFAPDATESGKKQRARYEQRVEGAAVRLALAGRSDSGRSLQTLYRELEQKLLGD